MMLALTQDHLGRDSRLRPETANSGTVWAQVVAVLMAGPEPGPGNSDGGPADTPSESQRPTDYQVEVAVPVRLQVSPEPGPGDSDGGGYDRPAP